MSPEARERSFDELASGLASGTLSRGKALRLMGAALVGGVLASIPRVAVAATCTNNPGACCTCELSEETSPGQFTVVRKKCSLLSTTGCSTDEQLALAQKCQRRCQRFQERKHSTLTLTNAQVGCNPSDSSFQSFCQKVPGRVRGTECGGESCTPPA